MKTKLVYIVEKFTPDIWPKVVLEAIREEIMKLQKPKIGFVMNVEWDFNIKNI